MIKHLRAWVRSFRHSSLYEPKTKRYYYEGDVAPDSLLNRDPNGPGIGAMVAIDPETKIITKIFFP